MKPPAVESAEPLVPPHWAQAVVSESLICRKCGYDLRGLSANGRCPECGMDIWTSVVFTVDPVSSRLKTLRNPRAVGNGLALLTLCMLVGTGLMFAPSASTMLGLRDHPWIRLIRFDWSHAAVIGALGLWGLWFLKPPRQSEPEAAVWVDLGKIALGLVGWVVFAAWFGQYADPNGVTELRERLVLRLASASFATVGLIGLRGVLEVIGQRSRAYRESRGGTQKVGLIVAAVVAAMVAALIRHIVGNYNLVIGDLKQWVIMLSSVVLWSSLFMVAVGLTYLFVNTWWIRRSLVRPAPPLDQVLMPKLSDDTWIPDREE